MSNFNFAKKSVMRRLLAGAEQHYAWMKVTVAHIESSVARRLVVSFVSVYSILFFTFSERVATTTK